MPADVNASESILSAGEGGKHLLTTGAERMAKVRGEHGEMLPPAPSETILQRAKIGSHRVGMEPPVGEKSALLDPFDDAVFRPHHYTCQPLGSMQIIEAVVPPYGDVHELAPFYIGTVLKYLYRAPHKGTCKQDLQKACWYLNRLVEALT